MPRARAALEFVKDLVASAPHSKVVAFGVKETDEEILALAAAGTAGYVRESAESTDVVRVLEQVMCDELTCSPRAAASLYRHVAVLSQVAMTPSVWVTATPTPCAVAARVADRTSDRLRTHEQADRAAGWESKLRRSRTTSTTCARNSRYTGAAEAVARIRAISARAVVARLGAGCESDAPKRAEHQKNPPPPAAPAAMSATPGPTPGQKAGIALAPRRPRPQSHGEALGCRHAREIRHTRATAAADQDTALPRSPG